MVHISEMAGHHVDLPEQVVTPGEELWVKIIDIDLQRRRISLSIKQAAEGGEVSEEYREAFGEHAYDEEGNYVGPVFAETEFTPETEAQAAWADYVAEHGPTDGAAAAAPAAEAAVEEAAVEEVAVAEVVVEEVVVEEVVAEAPAAEVVVEEVVVEEVVAEAPAAEVVVEEVVAEAPAAEAPAAEG